MSHACSTPKAIFCGCLRIEQATRAALPRVPTLIESGFRFGDRQLDRTDGSANTPREIVDRIAKGVSRAVKDLKTAGLLAAGVDPLGNTPDEFAAMIAAEIPVRGRGRQDGRHR